MRSDCAEPLNIGSDEMVTIDVLVRMAAEVARKRIDRVHVPGPLGVRGRNSNNDRVSVRLGWRPRQPLVEGIWKAYQWIDAQVKGAVASARARSG